MEPKSSNGWGGLLALVILALMGTALVLAPQELRMAMVWLFIGFGVLIGFAALIDKVREAQVRGGEQQADIPPLPTGGERIPGGQPCRPKYTVRRGEDGAPRLRVL